MRGATGAVRRGVGEVLLAVLLMRAQRRDDRRREGARGLGVHEVDGVAAGERIGVVAARLLTTRLGSRVGAASLERGELPSWS